MSTTKKEKIIRSIRQKMFSYSEEMQEKAGNLIDKLKKSCATEWKAKSDALAESRMRHHFM